MIIGGLLAIVLLFVGICSCTVAICKAYRKPKSDIETKIKILRETDPENQINIQKKKMKESSSEDPSDEESSSS